MISLVAAGVAAVLFGLSTVWQHGAASAVPHDAGGPFALLWRLARTPRWLMASGTGFVAVGFQALALESGSLIVVQAMVALGLVVALALGARHEGRRLRAAELAGGLVLVAGAVVLLAGGSPEGGRDAASVAGTATAAAVVVAVAAAALVANSLHHAGRRVALVLAVSAGCAFAFDALLLKGFSDALAPFAARRAVLFAIAYGVFAVLGNLLVQRSYQVATIGATLPALTAAEPVTAVLLGLLLLGERFGSAGSTVIAFVGVVAMVVGIVLAAPRRAEDEAAAAGVSSAISPVAAVTGEHPVVPGPTVGSDLP